MRELAVPAEAAGCCLAGKRCHARQAHVELVADDPQEKPLSAKKELEKLLSGMKIGRAHV
mgnify:CR=1 FL=1